MEVVGWSYCGRGLTVHHAVTLTEAWTVAAVCSTSV